MTIHVHFVFLCIIYCCFRNVKAIYYLTDCICMPEMVHDWFNKIFYVNLRTFFSKKKSTAFMIALSTYENTMRDITLFCSFIGVSREQYRQVVKSTEPFDWNCSHCNTRDVSADEPDHERTRLSTELHNHSSFEISRNSINIPECQVEDDITDDSINSTIDPQHAEDITFEIVTQGSQRLKRSKMYVAAEITASQLLRKCSNIYSPPTISVLDKDLSA